MGTPPTANTMHFPPRSLFFQSQLLLKSAHCFHGTAHLGMHMHACYPFVFVTLSVFIINLTIVHLL